MQRNLKIFFYNKQPIIFFAPFLFLLLLPFSCIKKELTTALAGNDTVIIDTNALDLYANEPASGTGTWSIIEGSGGKLENKNDPHTLFTGKMNTTYVLRWTIENSEGFSNDEITIRFINAAAYAGKDVIIYDDTTYQLNANDPGDGFGVWSIIEGNNGSIDNPGNPKATLTGSFGTTYIVRWTVKKPTFTDTAIAYDDVSVSFNLDQLLPKAIGGTDTIVYSANTINLNAQAPTTGTGTWTILQGPAATIAEPDNPKTQFQGIMDTSYALLWTVTNPYGTDTDTVNITFTTSPVANAGNNQTLEGTTNTTLNGNAPPPGGSGQWTIISGQNATINNPNNPGAQLTYNNIVYDSVVFILEWKVWNFNMSASDADQVKIIFKFKCGNKLIDKRDNQEYNTVKIGNQCWMAENLNIGTKIDAPASQANNGVIEKYCYNNQESNCGQCGGLYQWNEMMNYSAIESSQGICPDGWHVPSDNEFKILEKELGMSQAQADSSNSWRGSPVGTKLIQGGSSGFEALMCGRCSGNGDFWLKGSYEYPYTSTESGSNAWRRCLTATDPSRTDKVGRWNTFSKNYAFSVRCVKN
jgi:uncharacterized protein (TIGR02145 family)